MFCAYCITYYAVIQHIHKNCYSVLCKILLLLRNNNFLLDLNHILHTYIFFFVIVVYYVRTYNNGILLNVMYNKNANVLKNCMQNLFKFKIFSKTTKQFLKINNKTKTIKTYKIEFLKPKKK